MSIISNTSLITKGHSGTWLWQNKCHWLQIKKNRNKMHSLDANLKQLELAPIKSHPTNKTGPVNETRAQTNIIHPFFFFFISGCISEGQGCVWRVVGELDGFKTQFMPRPSLSLYRGCQPFDKHIKPISCGSQVTSILPPQSLSCLTVICLLQ